MRTRVNTEWAFFLLSLLIFCVHSTSAFPSSEIAVVIDCRGDGKVVPGTSDVGTPCEKGLVVNPGDWIKTGPGAAVTLAFDKGCNDVVTVRENSLAVAMPDGYFNMDLIEGAVFGYLENMKSNRCFRLMTPAVAMEAGSGVWSVRNEGLSTEVSVFDGAAIISGMNPDGSLKKDKEAISPGYRRKTMNSADPGELEANPEPVKAWSMEEAARHLAMKRTARLEMSENKLKIIEPPKSVFSKSSKLDTRIIYGGEEVDLKEYLSREKNKAFGKGQPAVSGK